MLYVLPNTFFDDESAFLLLPQGLETIVSSLTVLVAESERAGRRFLLKICGKDSVLARTMPIILLNEHVHKEACEEVSKLLFSGAKVGLVADAGMPGIADPGPELISYIRKKGWNHIRVIPGPCSPILALIASGFPGQSFTFHGYLPKDQSGCCAALIALEKRARHDRATQVFIETPYRNNAIWKLLLQTLSPDVRVCCALSLCGPEERLIVDTVGRLRTTSLLLDKVPAVFLVSTPQNAHE